ncbi:PRC-barrel domain-containing protein [Aquibium sp. ELW1220]|uniref:PRC-barrel domain-containing protein n=1 Tax=Aquibium sp. ELW1220 TaxID=2976766 RepID=UPI0025AFEF8A|nr:PRC-barrel domain-containing protein [Aquibium sp. ELW1220]MDN2580082.1 PRC-barrel domain-containing protein [Aquibium sp. ELW1220]
MLWNASSLTGYTISTTDGEIGAVDDLLFDDQDWTIRWLVVDTGSWLSGRKVLLPPAACAEPVPATRLLNVGISRQKVKDSPAIDTDAPVSRVQENDVFGHYGWQPYWFGPPYAAAAGMLAPIPAGDPAGSPGSGGSGVPEAVNRGDPHLRSVAEVTGYYIHASDGDIGYVEDFLLDAETWTLRYVVVDTKNWWPGKQTLVSPKSFRAVSWDERVVTTDLTRDRIRNAPEFDPAQTVDRAYEERFHDYYGYAGYWV